MRLIKFFFLIFVIVPAILFSQKTKIIESNGDHITIAIDFTGSYHIKDTLIKGSAFSIIKWNGVSLQKNGEPQMPGFYFSVGVPAGAIPTFQIISVNSSKSQIKQLIPYQQKEINGDEPAELKFDKTIYGLNSYYPSNVVRIEKPYVMRFAHIAPVFISPYQYNPVTRELIYNEKITVRINYNNKSVTSSVKTINDKMTEDFINTSVINKDVAVNWIGKEKTNNLSKKETSYWYSPNKEYYKIYLNRKGVYRVTYEDLVKAGFSQPKIQSKKLELFCNGVSVPIDVVCAEKDLFGPGDYLQFVGYPVAASPYCTMNIFNESNVYWLSWQAEAEGMQYLDLDGVSTTYNKTYKTSLCTVHYEKDLIYEHLGYAPDAYRDFWFWGKVTGRNRVTDSIFVATMEYPLLIQPDSSLTIRVNMHGMTNNQMHDAKINLLSYTGSSTANSYAMGDALWSNQTSYTYEKKFSLVNDSVKLSIYNELRVSADGTIAGPPDYSDEIRVNWFELDYWRQNIADTNHYFFRSQADAYGLNMFYVWEWGGKNVKVYIPSKGEIIRNAQMLNDSYRSVLFVDNCTSQTDYFCVSDDYFYVPDSIRKDVSSDIRNTANGADIIVIAHPKFMAAAEKYAAYRTANFPDKSVQNPRVKIVDIFQLYDEFSYGLVDPLALKDFVKYAFENWSGTAPQYVVLLGDMSWDYRQILSDSRPNFIPSIPYFETTYGQAQCDNNIVCVAGDDIYPDLAIGRLSCETTDEADVLINKIINYPSDNQKDWKQNILLIASGKDAYDDNTRGFDLRSMELNNNYIVPNGFETSKVFRYVDSNSDYTPYQGDSPEVRAGIDKGAALVNFYGHGGGYQWDFIFTNNDILVLNNGGRLPFVTSVTCYTAHFDNQDVFGEQFCKIPGKGAIAFWGSSALTYWDAGWSINNVVYDQIFNKKNYTIGSAVMIAKNTVGFPASNMYDMISTLTLLGDPALKLALPEKPDFSVKSSDISITPLNPVVGDTIKVKVYIHNYGTNFPKDTVYVQLFANGTDSASLIGTQKLRSFNQLDSLTFKWIPKEGKLYNLIVNINNISKIDEVDYTDNSTSASYAVYNTADPNFLAPADGYTTSVSQIDFLISDAGYYVNKNLTYFIEIDSLTEFVNPILKSSGISPKDGFASWKTSSLPAGKYFWRARVYDGSNYGRWSNTRTFAVTSDTKTGFFVSGKQLKLFTTQNINYSDSLQKLVINLQKMPPSPNDENLLESAYIDFTAADTVGLTTLATDGTYLYFATYEYYAAQSRIYKVGTGKNGTVFGKYYGTVPNYKGRISNSIIACKDGYLYAAVDEASNKIMRINPVTGDTATIYLSSGLINKDNANASDGAFYLAYDGNYVYNLAIFDKDKNEVNTLRIFDPAKNWSQVGNDIVFKGTSFGGYFTGFFVSDGYLYESEYFTGGNIMRFNISTATFEEQSFVSNSTNRTIFSWCYDWVNNVVYGGVKLYGSDSNLQIYKYLGTYTNSKGSFSSPEVGPASAWNSLTYNIETDGSLGQYSTTLLGYNKTASKWDTVAINPGKVFNMQGISPAKYDYVKFNLSMVDSGKIQSMPMKFVSLGVDYTKPGEIILRKNNFSFTPDTLLQGINTTFNLKAENFGYTDLDSVKLDCYLDESDSSFYSPTISIKKDSSSTISDVIYTASLLPSHNHTIKVIAKTNSEEFFTNNNIISQSFYLARDSVNPKFNITYDGKDILDGDMISAKPKIVMSLSDEGPLPLQKSYLTITHSTETGQSEILDSNTVNLKYSITNYPNSRLEVVWTPELEDGKHILEIIGKDASGNFFDTVSYKKVFYIHNQADIQNIYNYPNPFKNDTYFTFDLYGAKLPEDLYIKIYTVAGRLIKTINIPQSSLQIGFNRIYWNGRDQDGDELANGLYFYKIIYKNNQLLKTEIQKLAKVK